LGVVYVHAWTGIDSQALVALHGTGQDAWRWLLMEGLGRSAVPLLGLISGWLVAGSRRTTKWSEHVVHKARTILLPMVAWDMIAIIIVSSAAFFGTLRAPIPTSVEWIAQELFILTRNPDINVQMPFLRDLFLCMIAAPLMLRLSNRWMGMIVLLASAGAIAGWGPPLLMRASILAFFATGMIVRRTGFERRVITMPITKVALPFLLLMLVRLLMLRLGHAQNEIGMATIDLAMRFAAALFFWRLAWALSASRATTPLKTVEPYMFFMFCVHLIFIWTLAPLVGQWSGPLGSSSYPIFLVLQPFAALGLTVVVVSALSLVAPGAVRMLSGGRLQPRSRTRERKPGWTVQAAA
jgi:fucose 4-O-acetylase-like acetyltransferase